MIDANEFEVFVTNYQDMVYTTAIRLVANPADAEDISQQVFLKAYDHFDDIRTSGSTGGWLKTVARNLSLNHLSRYRARWRFFSEMSNEESETDYVDSLAAPDTLDRSLMESDYREMLNHALLKLPQAQRVPLVLFHVENLAYEEIAAHLGVSLSKVKTDIHRGRAALKKYLTPSLRGDERWEEKQMPEHEELDELLDRELRHLPPFTAPRSLAPRVMAAVRAKAAAITAPWWLQSWAAWPMYARAALFVAALLIASIFFSGSVMLDDQMRTYASQNPMANLLGDFATIGNTVALLWQKIGQPLFLTRIAVCVAMYFVCVGLGTAMFRVATRKNLQ